jgi:tRNA(adenine34) deaminase
MTFRLRASTVLVHNDRLLTFLGVDPQSGKEYLFLPGGAVESGETAPDTAIRETFEETGFRVNVDTGSAIERQYPFYWNGDDFDCLTIFYRGRLLSPMQNPVKDQDYNKGVVWLPVAEITAKFAYSAEILSAVEELISLPS